jgi:hypothetical protein
MEHLQDRANSIKSTQAEPSNLSQAVDMLMEEVMNSSRVVPQKTEAIIEILNRTHGRVKQEMIMEIDERPMIKERPIEDYTFVEMINLATRTIRISRQDSNENLDRIESILH